LEQGIWLYDTLRSRYPAYFNQVLGEDAQQKPTSRPSLR
jgi:hypothetical protein